MSWPRPFGATATFPCPTLGPTGPQLTDAVQYAINAVDVTFTDPPPPTLDPFALLDALNLGEYTVTRVVPFGLEVPPLRLLQLAESQGGVVVRLFFDGPLVEGLEYTITWAGGGSASFVAFGSTRQVETRRQVVRDRFDIANPQTERDAQSTGAALGTFQPNDTGGLQLESRRRYLRKRILRRLSTAPGGFYHLQGYGLRPGSKRLLSPTRAREMVVDARAQIRSEPGVLDARVTIVELVPGVYRMDIRVEDEFGAFDMTVEPPNA